MNAEQARAFAERWTTDWSRLDVEAVLSHYVDDVIFVSPKAATLVGKSRIEGKQALRAYWMTAVQKIQSIQFTLDYVTWDGAQRILTVVYQANLGGTRTRAVEISRFDERDQIVAGEAFYGAAVI